jgi:chaperonin GroEL
MKTKVLLGSKVQQKMLKGVRIMSDTVCTTLGIRGRNVAIAYSTPTGEVYLRSVIHDGVSVSKSIDLVDEYENMGASLLKQAAQKQVQEVGDGTTVTILLARALLDEIQSLVAAGVNPMGLRQQIEKDIKTITTEIERLSIPVTTFDQKKYIATVSAEDETLGELVAKVIEDMGVDGMVAVEESKNSDTTVDKQEGMQLDKGYLHQLFQTNPERMDATLENPYILVTDKDIPSLAVIKDIIVECAKQGNKLFIISPNFSPDAIGALIDNKMKGALLSLPIQAPSFGINQKNTLQDIAIFTGAKFITSDAGHKLEDIKLEDLGHADYVTSTKSETIIVGGKGNKELIDNRIESIKTAINKEDQDFDREKLKERLAKLTSGIAVIKVGGATEVEMLERLERVKDAVAATKASVISGIVPGGETIYLKAREVLSKDSLLYKVLYEPFKKLVNNAGLNDGQLYERLLTTKIKNPGIDVRTGEVIDMVKSGIIDPTMVAVQALINSSSVAVAISTTGALVIPDNEKTK